MPPSSRSQDQVPSRFAPCCSTAAARAEYDDDFAAAQGADGSTRWSLRLAADLAASVAASASNRRRQADRAQALPADADVRSGASDWSRRPHSRGLSSSAELAGRPRATDSGPRVLARGSGRCSGQPSGPIAATAASLVLDVSAGGVARIHAPSPFAGAETAPSACAVGRRRRVPDFAKCFCVPGTVADDGERGVGREEAAGGCAGATS